MEPIKTKLEAHKDYYFCNCGKGIDGIFCNGSHQGTDKTPTLFNVQKDDEYYLCACKKSTNTPFCDGSHMK